MKKLFLLLVLTCLANIGLAQTIISEERFPTLSKVYRHPLSGELGNYFGAFKKDSSLRFALSSTSNDGLRFMNEIGTITSTSLRDSLILMSGSVTKGFYVGNTMFGIILIRKSTNYEVPALISYRENDSIKISPLVPYDRQSLIPLGLIKLKNGLLLSLVSVASGDRHRRFVFSDTTGDTLYSVRINPNPEFPTSVQALELTSDTHIVNMYSSLGSNVLKEVVNLRLGRIDSREVIYRDPFNRTVLNFWVHSLPNNQGYYIMNGINIIKVNNGNIEWVNSSFGSRLVNPYVTMDGDIIGVGERFDTISTGSRLTNFIAKIDRFGNLVWRQEIGFVTRADRQRISYPRYEFSSSQGMPDGTAYFAGSRLDFTNNPAVDGIATPVLIRLSNVGLRYEPGYPVVTSIREREPRASIKIYPNPTKSSIQVSVEGTKVNYPILVNVKDVLGKALQSQMLYSSEEKVQVEHLSKGVYLLELEGIGTQKFVKE